MNNVLVTTIPVGLSGQVQSTNIHFSIQAGTCPSVHYRPNGEKICDCDPCTSCYLCRGGHQ